MSIINNVGYPNPVRSHFRSKDIWQTATDSHVFSQSGWLGRYLDYYGKAPHSAIEVNESLSLAMKGERVNAIAIQNPKVFIIYLKILILIIFTSVATPI